MSLDCKNYELNITKSYRKISQIYVNNNYSFPSQPFCVHVKLIPHPLMKHVIQLFQIIELF